MSYVHPSASATAKSASVGGLVSGLNMIAVVGCSSGAIPTFTPRFYQGAAALVADAGYGDAIEQQCRYYKGSVSSFNPQGLPTCFVRTPVTTPGAIIAQNANGVLGTSSIVASGTPNQRVDNFLFKVMGGGTLGTDGITFQYSFGGRDWSQTQRLGTALTWAVPNLGVTLTMITAMTLLAGDTFSMRTSGPRASNVDTSTALATLLALSNKFRCVLIVGDYAESDVNTLLADINLWYAGNKRSVFFVKARDSAQPVVAEAITGQTVTFAASGHTITRTTGSWVVDGFTTLDDVIVAGSTSNNGNLGKPTTVTATVLTFTAGVVNETDASTPALSIIGQESMSEWATALLGDVASFQDTDGRVGWGSGEAWVTSELRPGFRMRLPGIWAILERYMQHDIQISPNYHANGPIADWEITDDHGNIVEYDSRTLQVLEARGFLTLCSFVGEDGCFCGFPATFGPQGSALSVLPWRAVSNAFCDVVQQVTQRFVGDDPDLNPDGTLDLVEVERYTNIVNSELAMELIAPKQEGARASLVQWAPHSNDILNVPNAVMNGEGELETNGLINQVVTVVNVNRQG